MSELLNDGYQNMIASAFCHTAEMVQYAISNAAEVVKESAQANMAPHVLYKPKLFVDGDQWCALYGDNLQEGVAGFGNSPAKAMSAFDAEWLKGLTKPTKDAS